MCVSVLKFWISVFQNVCVSMKSGFVLICVLCRPPNQQHEWLSVLIFFVNWEIVAPFFHDWTDARLEIAKLEKVNYISIGKSNSIQS